MFSGLFFQENVWAQSCPWSIQGGTIQPAGIRTQTGAYKRIGYPFPTSWNDNQNIERGAPFEVGFVSSIPNRPAFYPGQCSGGVNGCGSIGWLYVEAPGNFIYNPTLSGQMLVINTSKERWSGSSCQSYGNNCSYGYRDAFGGISAPSNYSMFVEDPNALSNGYDSRFNDVGEKFSIFEKDRRYKNGSLQNYSTGDCSGGICACVPANGSFTIVDSIPRINFKSTRFCKGQSSIQIPIGISDNNGIDDIGEVNITLFSGSLEGYVWLDNEAAQRFNDWRFGMSPVFRKDAKGGNFMNYFETSFTAPDAGNVTTPFQRNPADNEKSGVIKLTISEKGSVYGVEDINKVEAYVNDAQFTGFLDPDNIESTKSANLEWIDPPSPELWWDPDVVTIDLDANPQKAPVKWNVSDADRCWLRVCGDGCENIGNRCNRPYPETSTRNNGRKYNDCDQAMEELIRIRKNFSGDTATCTAELEYEHVCGDQTLTADLTILKAQPWAMTAFGDTYASTGYGENAELRIWNVENSLIPGWAKDTGSGTAYFSTYLVSKNSGKWPSSKSLRGYVLNGYQDENQTHVGGVGAQNSIYEYLYGLTDINSSSCTNDGIKVIKESQFTASTDTCGPNDKKIFLISGDAVFDQEDWGTANPDAGCIVVVNGDITVKPRVSKVNAFILNDGTFMTESSGKNADTQLMIRGGVVSERVDLKRDIVEDSENPSEFIVYDVKYLSLFKRCLGENYPFQIREYGYSAPE